MTDERAKSYITRIADLMEQIQRLVDDANAEERVDGNHLPVILAARVADKERPVIHVMKKEHVDAVDTLRMTEKRYTEYFDRYSTYCGKVLVFALDNGKGKTGEKGEQK